MSKIEDDHLVGTMMTAVVPQHALASEMSEPVELDWTSWRSLQA